MNSLIILAHGSRREESNLEIKALATKVKTLTNDEYELIEYAYLELAEPDLLHSIDNIINKGATNITVLPYFLNSGNHVKRDIPAIIQAAIEKYPSCKIKMSACIGMSENMPNLILQQAKNI
jgi:sirohydrochlorin ferrochelatase